MSATNYHFREYLDGGFINTIKNDHGYTDSSIIEQFIMDYEILFHLLNEIPDLVIKGGMSVPFHIPDKKLRRLSVDIDVVTSLAKDKIESAIEKVRHNTNGLFNIPQPYIPQSPKRKLPLLTYYVPYTSSITNQTNRVKVEIFYDFKDELPLKSIDSGTELIGFKLDYPLRIFNLNTLIGDKITTLGFNTIGLLEEKRSDTIKHIYDVGTLIRLIENQASAEKLLEIFQQVAAYENSFNDKQYSYADIIADIISSLDSLLIQGAGYSLESSHEGRYCTFKTQLLQKGNSYNKLNHVSDILLIKLLASYLQLSINGKIRQKEVVDGFYGDLTRFNSIISQDGQQKKQSRKKIIQSFDTRTKGDFINTIAPAEQVFLFSRIENLQS
ncbi:MAG: nucleotidyl transferase AbiEii/AbiGii toxin family protein [Thaumarchaeota archaeon]|nr:nucleotidyl transferase AbiEii/AbiGii toxin family protein [Nitrososphaerota archaeon]